MDLDHVFVLVEPHTPLVARLAALGLVETYRRQHRGQGTANVCYCFENMFLGLLWITTPMEAASARIQRLGLVERANWAGSSTCPVGIGWRNASADFLASCERWPYHAPYHAPYLAPGTVISVAADSDDTRQPLMFGFPGATAPRDWHPSRQGHL